MTPPTTAPANQRDEWIDAARGIAALSVTIFHLNCVIEGNVALAWRHAWSYGHLGVPVFFVLSGWCITGAWQRAVSPADFSRRRLRRIFPPFLASWLLTVGLALFVKLVTGTNDVTRLPRTASAILANLTLTTQPVTHFPTVNWVYWSLSYELAFYGLLATLLFAPQSFRILAATLLHVALCVTAALWQIPHVGPFFFVHYWPLFGFGAALCLLDSAPRWAALMLLGSAVHAVAAWQKDMNFLYVATALVAGVALVSVDRLPFPRWLAPLRMVGIISYSVYLIHVPVGVFCVLRFLPPVGKSAGRLIAEQLVAIVLVLASAALFHRFAERPFMRSPARLRPTVQPAPA